MFFDFLGIQWEYEKQAYSFADIGGYLPDYWLPDLRLWVEIKGEDPNDIEMLKAERLCQVTKQPVAIISGLPWFNVFRAYYAIDSNGRAIDIAEYFADPEYDYEMRNGQGGYYQGWMTWGRSGSEKLSVVTLVERDDVRDAHDSNVVLAYAIARFANFSGAVPA